jgi:hypothetical protein
VSLVGTPLGLGVILAGIAAKIIVAFCILLPFYLLMIMKISILCLLLMISFNLTSQTLEWVKQFGGTAPGAGANYGFAVATDASSNVLTIGDLRGTADFDPGSGTYNLTSSGGPDVFVSKLDSSGNFIWANKMGSTGFDYGRGITTDAAGNVYIIGMFQNTVDFNPGSGVFNLTSNGDADIYIVKLDPNGNFIWAKSIGGSGFDSASSISVDYQGNVYSTGTFLNTVDFDPGAGTYNLSSIGGNDVFVSKLDANGNFIWAISTGGTGYDIGSSLVIDQAGQIIVAGRFSGTADFDPGTGTYNLNSAGSQDIFVSKIDSTGDFIWAKSMGGIDSDRATRIKIDDSDNLFLSGLFSGTSDFDPGAGVFNLTSAGNDDMFVVKLDANGNFIWAKSFGGISDVYDARIALDASGNVYTIGSFQYIVDLDPGPGVADFTSAGYNDVFISKLDAFGDFVWAIHFSGINVDNGMDIKVDPSGSLLATGYFQSTIDFDPTSGTSNMTSPYVDVFVLKFDIPCSPAYATDVRTECDSLLWMDGIVYTANNSSATHTVSNPSGCDSVITLNLTIAQSNTGSEIITACNSFTWPADGNTYNSTGMYTATLTNAAGCDSTATLDLTIATVDITTQPTDQTANVGNSATIDFSDGVSGGVYQWQMDAGTGYADLSNAGQFSGVNSNTLNISAVTMSNNNTNYRCIVAEPSGCSDTTDVANLTVLNSSSIVEQHNSIIQLFPNPANQSITITAAHHTIGQIIISNILGKEVMNKSFASNRAQLNLKNLASKGTYYAKVLDSNGNVIAIKKWIYH